MNPLWIQYADANRIAQMAGEALPNIVTAPFMDLFVYIGGGGATIGLALCLMFFSKSKAYKTLGKVSGIPALFNINTAILFTFPTVLNPIMLIPFVLTPVVNAIITYLAMMTKSGSLYNRSNTFGRHRRSLVDSLQQEAGEEQFLGIVP